MWTKLRNVLRAAAQFKNAIRPESSEKGSSPSATGEQQGDCRGLGVINLFLVCRGLVSCLFILAGHFMHQ